MGMKKVLVGLSGGVDSSISLYLLKEEGFEVFGVTMKIWRGESLKGKKRKSACFGPNEEECIKDAERVCEILKVPFYILDLSNYFEEEILEYVRNEYDKGRTPNPCVLCNRKIKFEKIPEIAKKEGVVFDYFATGHYARIEKIDGNYILKKALDFKKDQSYFLWRLTKEQISKTIFPLGNWKKVDVKNLAKKLKLPVYDKPESQDFFEGDLDFFLKKVKGGFIKNLKGEVLGKHKGIQYYTIGQRRGLGISYKEPLYVVKIESKTNTIYVGTKVELLRRKFLGKDANWLSLDENIKELTCNTKIRYKHEGAKAKVLKLENNKVLVEFEEPQLSITPGQSAVFYEGDILIGGAIIDEVLE